jgi:AmmeMemoRadiSam system protein A
MQKAVAGERLPEPSQPVPVEVEQKRGCFVSLHTASGGLRGCIGTFEESRPLWQTIREMATAAATGDPRFQAVTPAELESCLIEISALTPLAPAKPEEIVVGRDGICVGRGYFRGVLLPQVASEYGWDRETFLDHTCMKAGLPADAWRDGSVTIESFRADVFAEAESA